MPLAPGKGENAPSSPAASLAFDAPWDTLLGCSQFERILERVCILTHAVETGTYLLQCDRQVCAGARDVLGKAIVSTALPHFLWDSWVPEFQAGFLPSPYQSPGWS